MILHAGLCHRSGPVEARERLAAAGLDRARRLLASAGFPESVVLSTCNRFELYAAGGPERLARLAGLLDELSGCAVSERACRGWGADSVHHLFTVAAGLDSLVVGESEILGQIKQAYASAREAGSTAKLMNVLFQRALFVGKLVRSRTGIALGQTSVASVAVELAQRIFGPLRGREVLLLGAGATAEKAARHLREAKAGRLHIANRTFERAQALAAALGGAPGCARAVRWEGFPALLDTVDIVLASTGAPEPVLGRAEVEEALRRRRSSLFLIDIAMPRDIAQEVGSLDGAYLYTLCDLEALASDNALKRRGEADAAREIVRLEAQAFSAWLEASLRGEKVTLRRASLPAQAAA